MMIETNDANSTEQIGQKSNELKNKFNHVFPPLISLIMSESLACLIQSTALISMKRQNVEAIRAANASDVINVFSVIKGVQMYPIPVAKIKFMKRFDADKSFSELAINAAPRTAPSNAFPLMNGRIDIALSAITLADVVVVVGSGINSLNPKAGCFALYFVELEYQVIGLLFPLE